MGESGEYWQGKATEAERQAIEAQATVTVLTPLVERLITSQEKTMTLSADVTALTVELKETRKGLHSTPCKTMTKHLDDHEIYEERKAEKLQTAIEAMNATNSNRTWDIIKIIIGALISIALIYIAARAG